MDEMLFSIKTNGRCIVELVTIDEHGKKTAKCGLDSKRGSILCFEPYREYYHLELAAPAYANRFASPQRWENLRKLYGDNDKIRAGVIAELQKKGDTAKLKELEEKYQQFLNRPKNSGFTKANQTTQPAKTTASSSTTTGNQAKTPSFNALFARYKATKQAADPNAAKLAEIAQGEYYLGNKKDIDFHYRNGRVVYYVANAVNFPGSVKYTDKDYLNHYTNYPQTVMVWLGHQPTDQRAFEAEKKLLKASPQAQFFPYYEVIKNETAEKAKTIPTPISSFTSSGYSETETPSHSSKYYEESRIRDEEEKNERERQARDKYSRDTKKQVFDREFSQLISASTQGSKAPHQALREFNQLASDYSEYRDEVVLARAQFHERNANKQTGKTKKPMLESAKRDYEEVLNENPYLDEAIEGLERVEIALSKFQEPATSSSYRSGVSASPEEDPRLQQYIEEEMQRMRFEK